MSVDVTTEIEIEAPRAAVAAYASDPDNAPEWYANIRSVEWRGEPGLEVGARVDFVARFLGRRLAYTYEVVEYEPGERLVMSTTDGPFAMRTEYTWSDTHTGGTLMTLRNSGSPTGFGKVTAPFLAMAMRKANRQDLERIKQILER